MKILTRLSFLWLSWVAFATAAQSQPCVNGISTNPHNPVNNQFVPLANTWFPGNGTDTHNPWLNQWSWYWSDGNPTIYRDNLNWDHQWPGNAPSVAMVHPYDILMPEGFEYLRPAGVHPDLYDYRWEDGWELLWMNMGYYPDGHPINDPAPGSYYDNHSWNYEPLPSNAPYFAIYNRYRGLLRLFANVWYSAESTFENIDVVLGFTDFSGLDNELTGLLRHASAYDRPLSEPTAISAIHAPRFHAPDLTQWIVADFQMGYDPCSCNSTGELILDFNAFSTMDVDIIGRTIGLNVPINDTTYTTRDFLNLSDVNVGTYEPGTEIYQNMDRLAEQYRKKQLKYLDDLNAYNQFAPLRLALEIVGVKSVAEFIIGGLTGITLTDSLYAWINMDDPYGFYTIDFPQTLGALPPPSSIELPLPMTQVLDTVITKAFTDKAKKEIGRVFGNFSAEIFKSSIPGKPTPPTVPVATLEESVYKGTITTTATRSSAPLIIPGSLPQAWEPGTPLSPHRLPVYNEVMGIGALLTYPALKVYQNSTIVEVVSPESTWFVATMLSEFKFRFDEGIQLTLNPALDINFDKTKTYIQLEVDIESRNHALGGISDVIPTLNVGSNLGAQSLLSSENFGSTKTKLLSEWIPLEEANQLYFRAELTSTLNGAFGVGFPAGASSLNTLNYFITNINFRVSHDLYFDQIGTSMLPVNTLNVTNLKMYEFGGINNTGSTNPLVFNSEGLDNEPYIAGTITLGSETITTTHPLVHHVDGDDIFINAQEVIINGSLQVQQGYTLIIQALEQIHMQDSSQYNPKLHLRIKKDFYNTPVFEYANATTINNFCSQNGAYQANTASRPLMERILQEQAVLAALEKSKPVEKNAVSLHPNPTSGLLQITSSYAPITQVEVYDLSGRRLYHRNFGESENKQVQIDLSALSNGVYVVKTNSGERVSTERLVVGR